MIASSLSSVDRVLDESRPIRPVTGRAKLFGSATQYNLSELLGRELMKIRGDRRYTTAQIIRVDGGSLITVDGRVINAITLPEYDVVSSRGGEV